MCVHIYLKRDPSHICNCLFTICLSWLSSMFHEAWDKASSSQCPNIALFPVGCFKFSLSMNEYMGKKFRNYERFMMKSIDSGADGQRVNLGSSTYS